MSQIKGNSIVIKNKPEALINELKLKFIKCENGVIIDSELITLAISKASLKELIGFIDLKTFKEWLVEE